MKIICIMVTTVDGIIARDPKHNVDWSSPEDKKMFMAETKKIGAVIVGNTTYEVMGTLPNRFNLVLSLTPEKYHDKVIPGQVEFFKGSPREVVAHLEQRGITQAAVIGGARTNASFFKAGLVDEVMLTVEPKMFGVGLNFVEDEPLDIKLQLLNVKQLNKDAIQLHYQVIK